MACDKKDLALLMSALNDSEDEDEQPSTETAPHSSDEGRLVVIWDFDDTLVPWYRMKRGAKRLYGQWLDAEKRIQASTQSSSHPHLNLTLVCV